MKRAGEPPAPSKSRICGRSALANEGRGIDGRFRLDGPAHAQHQVVRGEAIEAERPAVGEAVVEGPRGPGLRRPQIEIAIRQVDLEARRNRVSDAGVEGPREVPFHALGAEGHRGDRVAVAVKTDTVVPKAVDLVAGETDTGGKWNFAW